MQLLKDKDWLKNRFPPMGKKIENIDIDRFATIQFNDLANTLKAQYLLDFHREMETKLRKLVRFIGKIPNVHSTRKKNDLKGNENYNLIIQGLIIKYLAIKKKDYQVLNLLSLIRNTLHNSGVYFSPNSKDKFITYRGITYHFKTNRPINFLSDELFEYIMIDLVKLIEILLTNVRISKHSNIVDPIKNIKFKSTENLVS